MSSSLACAPHHLVPENVLNVRIIRGCATNVYMNIRVVYDTASISLRGMAYLRTPGNRIRLGSIPARQNWWMMHVSRLRSGYGK